MPKPRSIFATLAAAGLLACCASAFAAPEVGVDESDAVPYLQNPSEAGMTVCLLSRGAQDVRVAWGKESAADSAEVAAQKTEIPGTEYAVWKARLKGAAPGTAYGYHVNYRLDGKDGRTALHRFTTLDPKAAATRFIAFGDIHNADRTLEAAMHFVKPEEYDFSLLLGDCWTDPSSAKGAKEVFRLLKAYVKDLRAADKPLVFLRGNHEVRGDFGARMALLFDLPNLDASATLARQRWNFTLRSGPAWFLALDAGNDFTKQYELFQPRRLEQAGWMKELFAKPGAAGGPGDAPWRIVLTHIPLYADGIWNSEPCRLAWEPVLKDAGIDVALAGHVHAWKLLPKGKTYEIAFNGHYPDQQDPEGRKRYSFTTPFPVLIGGGPALRKGDPQEGAVMKGLVTPERLRIQIVAATDGRLLTEFAEDKPPAASTCKGRR